MNSNIKICFDVDGTLIEQVGEKEDTPRHAIIQLFLTYKRMGCDMYIWSGGGFDYAKRWSERLGLEATIAVKGSFVPDIAVDDLEVELGKVNLRV